MPERQAVQFSHFSYDYYPFGDDSDTSGKLPAPTFKAPMVINRKSWAKILGMRKSGVKLVGADSKSWPIRKTPLNLRYLSENQRLYQPDSKGVSSPDESGYVPEMRTCLEGCASVVEGQGKQATGVAGHRKH